MIVPTTVEIAAPVPVVWALIDDPANLSAWMPEVVETRYPTGHDRARPVGTRFTQRIKEGGRVKEYEGVVTAYEASRLLGIRLIDKNFAANVTYTLSEDRGGTRLDYVCAMDFNSWPIKLLGFLARPMSQRLLNRHMARLKAVAEQRAAAASA